MQDGFAIVVVVVLIGGVIAAIWASVGTAEAYRQAPADVEAELAQLLSAPAAPADTALEAEIRELVIARNARRARQGKPPLDVEDEVQRSLRELT